MTEETAKGYFQNLEVTGKLSQDENSAFQEKTKKKKSVNVYQDSQRKTLRSS